MHLDPTLVRFVITGTFAFLIGLEVKTYREQYHAKDNRDFFGTTRTMTFMGILGFILYQIDPVHLVAYAIGMIGFTALYLLFYLQKLKKGKSSILLYLVTLVIYSFGPFTQLYPLWMTALLFVMTVFILNAKRAIQNFTAQINAQEFETLGKMILLSGVILPLLPDNKVISYIPLSPFKIWLAVVIISAISYGGYLVQKYLFKNRGYFVTGIIGGLYSSTATTVVLARKIKNVGASPIIDAGIISATSMMYLRLIVVSAVFNLSIAKDIFPAFVCFALLGLIISLYLMGLKEPVVKGVEFVDKNPLELGTALLFAGLFVAMMMLTSYITAHYGDTGLRVLSFITGLTDIDPFILSLLTGKYSVTQHEIISAILIAAGSNNVLKATYAFWFGGGKSAFRSALVVFLLGIGTIAWALFAPYRWM